MSSSTSLKELSKAIQAFYADPVSPIPDDLVETIASYLRRHQKYDEAASDRLQEELLSLYDKHVKSGGAAAHGAWIALLRHLLPVLQTPERILQWFDVLKGVVEKTAHERGFVNETMSGLMALVTFADEYHEAPETDAAANPILGRLFSIWMDRMYPAFSSGSTAVEYQERIIREALGQFGRRRPKEFFTALNGYLVQNSYRKASLRFFCDFLQSQPLHLHQILHTPLFTNLLACLQHDTSTTVISAALTSIVMLLPHMPSSLVPYLPTLFNIYARLLFWTQERTAGAESASNDSEQARGWEVFPFDAETEDMNIPHLANYFTILYGLYPINFMDYIRKPQRYLRHANAAAADEMTVQPTEMRHQSEKFRRQHLLHPNFHSLTIETEKTDFGRWIKSEAAEVVAECMSLSLLAGVDISSKYQGPEPEVRRASSHLDLLNQERDSGDPLLLQSPPSKPEAWGRPSMARVESGTSHQMVGSLFRQDSSQSQLPTDTMSRESISDSSTFLSNSSSQTQLQDMLLSNKAIKSTLQQSVPNDSVPSLTLSHADNNAERGVGVSFPEVTTPSVASGGNQVQHLQRQILLLQNDLSFERYLKRRHMEHIGDLRRKQVIEAASEAEAQNLILQSRNLKSRYEEAKKAEMQVRKESEKSRGLAKKWEADLSTKLKNLRDESKKTVAELEGVRKELERSRDECNKIRRLLCEAEVKEINSEQHRKLMEAQAAEAERLRGEVDRLTALEKDFRAEELGREAAMTDATHAQDEVEVLRMKVGACERDLAEARKNYQSHITLLRQKLADAQEERQHAGPNASLLVENALGASRAKQAEMQQQHDLLLRKYKALQSSLLDMESGAKPEQIKAEAGTSLEHDGDVSPTSPSVSRRGVLGIGLQRGTSAPDGTSFNVTPPLDKALSPSLSFAQRPGSPEGGEPPGFGGLSTSPEMQRYWGRGGVQNRFRKESKDQARDESPGPPPGSSGGASNKERKRSTALRGIRGFVQQH